MSEPRSAEEYMERFAREQKVEGYGIEGVTMRMPCPFCAAPDYMVFRVVDTDKAMEESEPTCEECGRSGKFVVERDADGGVHFEFVQTGGNDPPDWLTPTPRRV